MEDCIKNLRKKDPRKNLRKKKPKKKAMKKKRVKKTGVSISNKNTVKVVIINQPKTKSKRKPRMRMRSRSLPIQIHDPVRHQKAYTPTFHRPMYNGVEGTINPTANQILNQKKIDLQLSSKLPIINVEEIKNKQAKVPIGDDSDEEITPFNRVREIKNKSIRNKNTQSGGIALFDSDDDDDDGYSGIPPRKFVRKRATSPRKQPPRFTSSIAERAKLRRAKSLTSTLKNSAAEVKKKMSSRF